MGPYGRKKIFQTASPLKVHMRFTPKTIMPTLRKGLYQSCPRNCEMSTFGFFFSFFFLFVNMGPYGVKVSKDILYVYLWEGSVPELLKE